MNIQGNPLYLAAERDLNWLTLKQQLSGERWDVELGHLSAFWLSDVVPKICRLCFVLTVFFLTFHVFLDLVSECQQSFLFQIYLFLIIIFKVFIKHKSLSVETVLRLCTCTNTCIGSHPHFSDQSATHSGRTTTIFGGHRPEVLDVCELLQQLQLVYNC